MVYGRPAPSLLSYILGTAKVEAVEKELMDRDHMIKDLRVTITEAQVRMKKVYDRHHREREFMEGDGFICDFNHIDKHLCPWGKILSYLRGIMDHFNFLRKLVL